MPRTVKLCLIGFGNVGQAFILLAERKKELLEKDYGVKLIITAIATGRHGRAIDPDGIDTGKACTILAAFELSKRALNKFNNTLPIIDSPQKAVDQLTDIRTKSKEHFVCLYLNARNQLIHKEVISIDRSFHFQ